MTFQTQGDTRRREPFTASVKLNPGPAFFALCSFLTSFVGARIFTTINPDTVVVTGGIHFHHFWYGLAMVLVAGWLGIALFHPALNRVYATVFGLGFGLIGDEVGLLLTFGDYHSLLTYEFFAIFMTGVFLATLVLRYWRRVLSDLESFTKGEGMAHVGVVVAGLSSLPLSLGFETDGIIFALAGLALATTGLWLHLKSRAPAVAGTAVADPAASTSPSAPIKALSRRTSQR